MATGPRLNAGETLVINLTGLPVAQHRRRATPR